MGQNKINIREKVYKEIRRIAIVENCDKNFLNEFDACYSHLYEVINDLPIAKQICITIKCMSMNVKSARISLGKILPVILKNG